MEPLRRTCDEPAFPSIPHKSPPWKTATKKFEWVNPFFHKKWGHKISKFRLEPLRRTWDEPAFPSIPHNSPPWKTATKKFVWVIPFFSQKMGVTNPKFQIFCLEPLRRRGYEVVFPCILDKQTPSTNHFEVNYNILSVQQFKKWWRRLLRTSTKFYELYWF